MTVVNTVPDGSAENAQPEASVSKTRGSRRPRVSPAEMREIARLYADTSTSTSEICARLHIGESTLYRIVQRQGLPQRGRTVSSRSTGTSQPVRVAKQTAAESTAAPSTRGAKSATGKRRTAAVVRRPRVEAPVETPAATPAPTPTPASTRRPRSPSVASPTELRQFVLTFVAEQTFEAESVLDALQQVQARGATEVTSIVRIA